MSALLLQARPAQRLLVQGVMAVSATLIRKAQRCHEAAAMRGLMAERRRLLRELANGIEGGAALGCYEAMRSAVTESDRALDHMLASSGAGN